MALDKIGIAKRIGQELKNNTYVNLGIGIPTLVANYVPKNINVEFQSENGVLGMGPFPLEGEEDPDMINAGKQTITTLAGAVLFDSSMSFAINVISNFCRFLKRLVMFDKSYSFNSLPKTFMTLNSRRAPMPTKLSR